MKSLRRVVSWPVPAMVIGWAACSGDGSDIGPSLPKLPNASCKVIALDDQGRGVVGAQFTVGGSATLSGRSGRGELFSSPRGRLVVAVDGANGAAVAGDRLGSMRFAATVVGPDLPAVVFLPELPDSASAIVTLGIQVAPVTVTSVAGAILSVPAGRSVGFADPVTTVTLRLGDLQAAHVPGDLPSPVSGALLTGRVCCIDPPGVTFTPAVDLEVADDLVLGASLASLFHLDPTTGEWTEIKQGLSAASGRITATGAVASGGLYVFGCQVPGASVTGRVLNLRPLPVPIPDVMVSVDGRDVVTDREGRFIVSGLSATFGDGSARTATVELFAGGSWLPVRRQTTTAVTSGAIVDAGDFVLDTVPAGNVRLQQVLRGRGDALQPARLSAGLDSVALATFGDASGQSLFEDIPAEWFGLQDGRPIDSFDVIYGQSLGFFDIGRRWHDTYQFLVERPWFLGSRSVRATATDATGGGPLPDVAFVAGSSPLAGFIGITEEAGTFQVDRGFDGRATASLRTARDGQMRVHAISIERPDADHLELPLRRVLRTSTGAFDRHGLVTGVLQGADPGREHRLRTTRRLDLQEWWDDVAEGIPILSALPVDVDPAVTHAAFAAGVDRNGGHLAAAEVTTVALVSTLLRLGIVADLVPVEGAGTSRDIALDLPATTAFLVPSAAAGLHASIPVAELRCSLALEQPSGRIVDVVRGLGGNHAAVGSDLAFQLPALTGQLAGHRWRVLVRGFGAAVGGTVSQQSLLALRGDGAESPAPFLAPPVISSPTAGSTVSANGFTVQYSLPPAVLYATLELRSVAAGEELLWQVFVPPGATQFTFVRLPLEAVTPLVAGKTYTLTLSAFRALGGPLGLSVFSYGELSTFLQSIGTVERGVDSVSSHSITITSS